MEKKPINISEILECLKGGKTRKEINELYDLNPVEVKALWNHPKLKNKKTAKYVMRIDLVDDTEVNVEATEDEVVLTGAEKIN